MVHVKTIMHLNLENFPFKVSNTRFLLLHQFIVEFMYDNHRFFFAY